MPAPRTSREDAFPVEMTGPVLQALEAAGVTVLGGDFFEMDGEAARPTGMNWYDEGRDPAESVTEARRALRQRGVGRDWFATFVWR